MKSVRVSCVECAGMGLGSNLSHFRGELVSGHGSEEKRRFASVSEPPVTWAINPAAPLLEARERRLARLHAWRKGWKYAKTVCGAADDERVLSAELEPNDAPDARRCTWCQKAIKRGG